MGARTSAGRPKGRPYARCAQQSVLMAHFAPEFANGIRSVGERREAPGPHCAFLLASRRGLRFAPPTLQRRRKRNAGKRCASTSAPAGAARARMRLPRPRCGGGLGGGALACRRSTTALAEGTNVTQGAAQASFLGRRLSGRYPPRLSQSSEHLTRRSSCRQSMMPKPPGSEVYGSARGHRTRSAYRNTSRKASLTERDSSWGYNVIRRTFEFNSPVRSPPNGTLETQLNRSLAVGVVSGEPKQEARKTTPNRKAQHGANPMLVWVNPYYRISRWGRIIHVRGYWRRWPRRSLPASLPLPHPPAA